MCVLLCSARVSDLNGDESISVSEFREGVLSLQSLVGFEFLPSDLDSLLSHIDSNGDGEISYAEFFAGFKLADKELDQQVQQRRSAMITLQARKNKSGSGVPPSQPPSPSISPRTMEEHKNMAHEDSPR